MNALSELSGALPRGFPLLGHEGNLLRPFPFPGNMAVGLTQSLLNTQAGGSESAWHREYIQSAQLPRKPPQREGIISEFLSVVWQESSKQVAAELQHLRTEYIFRNDEAVNRFLSSHRTAIATLSNAIPELKKSFGPDVVFTLETTGEDDDSAALYAIAVWRGPVEAAESALEDFDERWWLGQTPQVGVTFTYELA